MRRAILVHAGSVPAEVFENVVDHLATDGASHLVRAVGDWTRPELAGWLTVLRRGGIAMRHHFRTRDTHDPALVALTVEALGLVDASRIDQVVLVGDVGAATPLVDRLQELGVAVTGVGPAGTPHQFRAACDEFWDLSGFAVPDGHRSSGRHRAG